MTNRQEDDSHNRDPGTAPHQASTSFASADATLPVIGAVSMPIPDATPGLPLNFGRYQASQLLGKGAFGEVYRGFDPQLARFVAIKVLRKDTYATPNEFAEFEAEARTLAGLDHGSIVPVFDFGTTAEGRCFFVTKFVLGVDLAHAIADRRFTPREAALLVAAVAEALHYAHKRGVVHRDVKPANILLEDGKVPLLADFGLALRESQQRERVGEQAGTPAYMSPEQARAEAHRLDGRTDIWSLGVVLYEILTGRKPFTGGSLAELFDEIEHREPKPPRQIDDLIPAKLEQVCLKAMAKRVVDRFTTAQDMADELRRAVAETDGAVLPTTRPLPSASAVSVPPSSSAASDVILDDNVQFSVYRPKTIKPKREYRLLAFAHLGELPEDAPAGTPEPIEEVRQQAAETLGEEVGAYGQTVQDSAADIPRWGVITFIPEVTGVEFFPKESSFTWHGKTHKSEFRLQAAELLAGNTARGRLSVFLGAILIADVPLNLRVDAAESLPDESHNETEHGRRFRKVYAAYSQDDRTVVAQFESYAAIMGDQYVAACSKLRGADGWHDDLTELIRQADVFQLFWSKQSMQSLLVKREWECALSLARTGFIRPIYWEDPLPEDPSRQLPPSALKQLTFTRIRPAMAVSDAAPTSEPAEPKRKHEGAEARRLALEKQARRLAEEAESLRQAELEVLLRAQDEPLRHKEEDSCARAEEESRQKLAEMAAAKQAAEQAADSPKPASGKPNLAELKSKLAADVEAKRQAKQGVPPATGSEPPAEALAPRSDLQNLKEQLAAQAKEKAAQRKQEKAAAPPSSATAEPGMKRLDLAALKADLEAKRANKDSPTQSAGNSRPLIVTTDTVASFHPHEMPSDSSGEVSKRGEEPRVATMTMVGASPGSAKSEPVSQASQEDGKDHDRTSVAKREIRPWSNDAKRARSTNSSVNQGLGCILFAIGGILALSNVVLINGPDASHENGLRSFAWLAAAVCLMATTAFGVFRQTGFARVAWGVGFVSASILALWAAYSWAVS